jgi:hypothetical protein
MRGDAGGVEHLVYAKFPGTFYGDGAVYVMGSHKVDGAA